MGWGVAHPFHHENDVDSRLRAFGGGGQIASPLAGQPEIHQDGVEFPAPQQRQCRGDGIHRAHLARAVAQNARTLLL